jgi:hypothetical protein
MPTDKRLKCQKVAAFIKWAIADLENGLGVETAYPVTIKLLKPSEGDEGLKCPPDQPLTKRADGNTPR